MSRAQPAAERPLQRLGVEVSGWPCLGCGENNPVGTKFCGHCGRPAQAADPPAPGAAREAPARSVEDLLRSFISQPVADKLVEAGGQLNEERRLVTALFADLSGFTTLAGRLDPEQLLEVIDPVLRGLTDIVGAHGGYVEKFAGDALLAFFGAPVAHEDDAERALRVALEMHARLPALCAGTAGNELTLHVGVNTGHVVARMVGSEIRMDYAVLGDAVVMAQRMEANAPSGETYVGESTYRLTAEHFELVSVGPLQIKGRAQPVPAWRLIAEKAPAVNATGGLFGRDHELVVAHGALARLTKGSGVVLALIGEPGVGKSRLLQELRRDSTEAGTGWSESRCVSSRAAVPYYPYITLLRSRLGVSYDAPPAVVADALRDFLDELGVPDQLTYLRALMGLPGDGELDPLEPQALRRALDEAVIAWAQALARRGPTALVIEDLHWADPSSLALTTEIVRRCTDVPLALVLTARDEAAAALDTLTEGLGPERAWLVHLGSVDAAALEPLLVEALGGPVTADLVRLVEDRSEGNPLFALEMVRSLRDAAELQRWQGVWATRPGLGAAQVPPTIEGLLSARMDLLPRPSVQLLQAAAVIGRRVRGRMLVELLGAEPLSGAPLALLLERGMLERAEDDLLVFPHVLVQEVAYSRLLRRQALDLHARVAEVAERLYGSGDQTLDLLARHLYLARAGSKAVDFLLRAGGRAAGLFANAEAVTHLERAIELIRELPDERHRLPAVLLDLAEIHEIIGRYDEALRLYDEVRQDTGDMRAWRGAAGVLRKQGRYPAALALLDEGLDLPGTDAEDRAALLLERGRTELFEGRFAAAVSSLRLGVSVAAEAGPVAAQLLLTLTRAELGAGDPATALEVGSRALEQLQAQEDARGLATGLRIVGNVYEALGRFDEAAATLRAGLAQAERTGEVEEIGGCLLNLGLVEIGRGRPEAAIESSRRALVEFDRVGHRLGSATASANLAEWLLVSGRQDEADVYCEQALTLAEEIGDRLTLADAMLTRALIRLAQGRPKEAEADADRATAEFAELGALPFADRGREVAEQARLASRST